MKKMINELEAKGIEIIFANNGYIALYHGSFHHNNSLIGYYKINYGIKGTYIRYNRTTYYFD